MQPMRALAIEGIERPHPRLLTYYLLKAVIIPPLFPLVILPLYFRYHTLRYRFDDEGVSMRWGILFRREIVLNYARLQDIQLRANVVERWLGLTRIELQTAAGNSGAEMALEGLLNYEEVRDFLYARMRGARGLEPHHSTTPAAESGDGRAGGDAELAQVLKEIAAELRALRETLKPPS